MNLYLFRFVEVIDPVLKVGYSQGRFRFVF
jgi:hypothetical protein